ncbi:unnamed protein product [Amoebophrya sp. A120]|nr:unnamed protein product [Amoebophrya sp. A120]|eukprot:GSA120T00020815001.1
MESATDPSDAAGTSRGRTASPGDGHAFPWKDDLPLVPGVAPVYSPSHWEKRLRQKDDTINAHVRTIQCLELQVGKLKELTHALRHRVREEGHNSECSGQELQEDERTAFDPPSEQSMASPERDGYLHREVAEGRDEEGIFPRPCRSFFRTKAANPAAGDHLLPSFVASNKRGTRPGPQGELPPAWRLLPSTSSSSTSSTTRPGSYCGRNIKGATTSSGSKNTAPLDSSRDHKVAKTCSPTSPPRSTTSSKPLYHNQSSGGKNDGRVGASSPVDRKESAHPFLLAPPGRARPASSDGRTEEEVQQESRSGRRSGRFVRKTRTPVFSAEEHQRGSNSDVNQSASSTSARSSRAKMKTLLESSDGEERRSGGLAAANEDPQGKNIFRGSLQDGSDSISSSERERPSSLLHAPFVFEYGPLFTALVAVQLQRAEHTDVLECLLGEPLALRFAQRCGKIMLEAIALFFVTQNVVEQGRSNRADSTDCIFVAQWLRMLATVLGAKRAILYIYDAAEGELVARAATGNWDARFSAKASAAEEVFRTGGTTVRLSGSVDKIWAPGESVLAVPVFENGGTMVHEGEDGTSTSENLFSSSTTTPTPVTTAGKKTNGEFFIGNKDKPALEEDEDQGKEEKNKKVIGCVELLGKPGDFTAADQLAAELLAYGLSGT